MGAKAMWSLAFHPAGGDEAIAIPLFARSCTRVGRDALQAVGDKKMSRSALLFPWQPDGSIAL